MTSVQEIMGGGGCQLERGIGSYIKIIVKCSNIFVHSSIFFLILPVLPLDRFPIVSCPNMM